MEAPQAFVAGGQAAFEVYSDWRQRSGNGACDMSDQIEIKIDAKRLTPDAFLASAKDFFALVEGVAKNVTTTPINWGVEVDKGSAIVRMRVENPSRDSTMALSIVSQGLRAMRTGTRVIPKGFTVPEIYAARRLAKLSDGENVQSVSIRNGGAPEALQDSVAHSADLILSGTNTGGIWQH